MEQTQPKLGLESQQCVEVRLPPKKVPTPQLLSNIPLLYSFLYATVQDWKRVSAPYQYEIDQAPPDDHVTAARAFMELQPDFLRYLFSYCFFFVSAENAFRSLHDELKDVAGTLGLHAPDPPAATAYVRKVRTIRNMSIAHMPSNRGRPIMRTAAMDWQPLTWGKKSGDRWDVDAITFGGLVHTVRDSQGNVLDQSDDICVQGIFELHEHCIRFLNAYDAVCCDLLSLIRVSLQAT